MTIRRITSGVSALITLTIALTGCTLIGGGGSSKLPEPDPNAPGAITAGDLNVTQTDPGLDVDIVVQRIGAFQPALPTTQTDTGVYIRMVGVRLASDVTRSDYVNVTPYPAAFALVAADGQRADCRELYTKGPSVTQSAAILAAIGGDQIYDFVNGGETPEGWMVCMTTRSSDASFNKPGIELRYVRGTAKDSAGAVIPMFKFSVPIPG